MVRKREQHSANSSDYLAIIEQVNHAGMLGFLDDEIIGLRLCAVLFP